MIIFVALLLGVAVFFVMKGAPEKKIVVTNFNECVAAGYAVGESYPRQCFGPEGKSFTEDIGNAIEKADLIRVSYPPANAKVQSPFTVTGEARGTWYFEASFPVKIFDANGKQLGVVPAQAQGEWMTENFVPFAAELTFEKPTTTTGTLVLEKDNPSGLPEHADELRIPIVF